ncbi:MAG TPA: hypothetical protein VLF94_05030 [Chlamydiales bacterium]|nr:hypothetical protein [Chlamydiales bacterium]
MNENEIGVRKQWLFVLIAAALERSVYTFTQTLTEFKIYINDASMTPPVWLNYALAALVFGMPLCLNYLLYHCAFRKSGTKLLTFFLIMTPIGFIFGIRAYFVGKVPLPGSSWLWMYVVLDTGLAVWFYLLSWKMRAINKRRQAVLKSA